MSTAPFLGFPEEGMRFLRDLAEHNERDWFQPRKEVYDRSVKAPMTALVQALNEKLMTLAPEYVTEPRHAVYRVYRDTRFTLDKTPYKTHIAASFIRKGLEKHAGAGFYFSVSPKEVEIAAGAYMPGPEQLRLIRGHVAEHYEELRRELSRRAVREHAGELQGAKLIKMPKGWPAGHPAADLLRGKQWYFDVLLPPDLAHGPKLQPEIVKRFTTMLAVVEFLNTPLVAARPKVLRTAALLA